jgi:NAD(P)-dependent dehydrogenase (short-subunit alcohol dehydrogenase family)
MVESLRFELRPSGIEASVIEPGHIRTAFKENRRKSEIFKNRNSVHQDALDGILRFGNRPKGPGPDRVARKIISILQSPRLDIRYSVGWDAWFVPFASWFIPEFMNDALMNGVYRFCFHPSQTRVGLKPEVPVVLVTGASSGIGLATTVRLAKSGYKVWAGYRNPFKVKTVRKVLEGLNVTLIRLDVDRTLSVQKAVQMLLRQEGRLDVVVNNAGFVTAGFWEDMSEEDVRVQFETNVFGVLRVCRETLPALRSSGGRIVNIGSTSAFGAYPLLGPYSATKYAIRAITSALRMEENPSGVQVTEINPGEIKTNVVNSARMAYGYRNGKTTYLEVYKEYDALVRKGMVKAPSPDVVANVVMKALSDQKTKRHYFVDQRSRCTIILRWLLPSRWCEWFIGRYFKWSRNPKLSR